MSVFAAPSATGTAARRGLAALMASGLVVAAAATAASADPAPRRVDTGTPPKAAVGALTTPTVKVPAEVTWSVASIDAVATPPPPPEPEPAAVVTRNAPAASRSGERPAVRSATRPAAAPAPAGTARAASAAP
ncbi:hypothetical protein GB883_20260, partial [Georgenia thermotolerans]